MRTKREHMITPRNPRRLWVVRDEEGAALFMTSIASVAATWERNGLEVGR